jgi:hypothetical protein
MATTQKQIDRYRADNIVAAEIILADAVRYGGEDSLMVRWARLLVAGSERSAA